MNPIRILIADDHPLLRDALRSVIQDEDDLTLLGEVDNGLAAVEAALALRPDLAIIDLYMPGLDGLEVIRRILAVEPEMPVLVFTSAMEDEKVAQAVEAGALGYLIKDARRSEIVRAIHAVSQGQAYLPPAVAARLASGMRRRAAAQAAPADTPPLTSREQEVLALIAEGASNEEIAARLCIGQTTVRTHLHNILQKMGYENRSQLMMHLLRNRNDH